MNRRMRQFLSLGRRAETRGGIHFVFVNEGAPLLILPTLVMSLAFAFASRSALPLLLLLIIPFCFVKTTWRFRYAGPTVERGLSVLGVTFWARAHPLQQGDRACVEPIDSLFAEHPPLYRMTLWSTASCIDRVVVRARRGPEGLEQLECTAELFNEAIEKVLRESANLAQ